jgi:TPR repeat protein
MNLKYSTALFVVLFSATMVSPQAASPAPADEAASASGDEVVEAPGDEPVDEKMAVVDPAPDSPEKLYDIGAGNEKHGRDTLAITYYRLAADAGHEEALYKVRYFYVLGTFRLQDVETAIQKLTRDASDGYANAQCLLAVCYDVGIGVTSDLATALRFFDMAAKQDNPRAMFELGRYNEEGLGNLDQNISRAIKFYERAAQPGYEPALISLASIKTPSSANDSPSPSHLTSDGKATNIKN